MSDPYSVRPAEQRDAEAIAALCNEFAHYAGEDGTKMNGARVAADLLAADSGLHVLVAERDARLVGYALFHVAYETQFAAKGFYLSDLYVMPAARRMGIATDLIVAVAEAAHRDGREFLWWVAKDDAVAAKLLYDKLADVSLPVTAYAATGKAFDALLAPRSGTAGK